MKLNRDTGYYQFDLGDTVVLSARGISNGMRGEVVKVGKNGAHCWVKFPGMDKPECYRNRQGGERNQSNGARGGVGKPTITLA